MRSWRRPLLLASFALVATVACRGPHVSLPLAPGADDDDDDDRMACGDAGMCDDREDKLCHPLGYCVECLSDSDCADGYACDRENECERSRN